MFFASTFVASFESLITFERTVPDRIEFAAQYCQIDFWKLPNINFMDNI